MKSRAFGIVVGVTLTLAVAACGDDDPTNPGGDSPMRATIDGQAWSAQTTPGSTMAMRTELSNVLSIAGTNNSLRTLNLTILDANEPGTYQLTAPSLGSVADGIGVATWMSAMPGGSGTATITVMTAERIAGTFEFTALPTPGNASTGTIQVTNGKFDMAWTGSSGF